MKKVFFIFLLAAALPWVVPAFAATQTRTESGLFPDEIVSMDELRSLLEAPSPPTVLDARGSDSFHEGHVRSAVLPLSQEYYRQEALFREGLVKNLPDVEKALAEGTKKYPKDAAIVTYCNDHCEASTVLFYKLKKLGFTRVRVMKPGFQSWRGKGYPVASDAVPYVRGFSADLRVDENLSMRVLTAINNDEALKNRAVKLKVTAKNAEVTAEGVVNDAAERALFEKKIRAVDGVKSFKNKLRVKKSDKDLLGK